MEQRHVVRGYAFWGLVVILGVLFVVLWPQPVGVKGQTRPSPADQKATYTLYYPLVPLGQISSRSSQQPSSTPSAAPTPVIAQTRTFAPTPTAPPKQPPPVVDIHAPAVTDPS